MVTLLEFDLSAALVEKGGIRLEDLRALEPELSSLVAAMDSGWRSGSLPFLGLPDVDPEPLLDLARQARQRFDRLVVLGIGGSSLGARAVLDAVGSKEPGHPAVWFNENVDPDDFRQMMEALDWERTQFNVITKSGSTIETLSGMFIVLEELEKRFGEGGARERIVVTTDPETGPLRAFARERGFTALQVPPGVGGRYSVLCPVGLYPCAFGGVDVAALLSGAARARERCLSPVLMDNPAALFAGLQVLHYRSNRPIVVFMPYATALGALAEWFCQLWAESLGKRRGEELVGPTPLRALGVTDQHSQLQLYMEGPRDKNVVLVEVKQFRRSVRVPMLQGASEAIAHLGGKDLGEILQAELQGTQQALIEVGCPTSNLRLSSLTPGSLGALLMMLEVATPLAGGLLGVNPYDQPGVELGKRYAHGLLGRAKEAQHAESLRAALAGRTRVGVTI
ncbi:MAG: hypothetical protein JW797_07050 [Bradymonadales bacterium]|nr:hypothetical protein [Bradymonadales bacterium]